MAGDTTCPLSIMYSTVYTTSYELPDCPAPMHNPWYTHGMGATHEHGCGLTMGVGVGQPLHTHGYTPAIPYACICPCSSFQPNLLETSSLLPQIFLALTSMNSLPLTFCIN